MEFADIQPFLQRNHRGVVMTLRPAGSVQASVVVCGAYQSRLIFVSVRGNSAKVSNLRRDANCTVLAVADTWRSYVVVEGTAQLKDYRNTPEEDMRLLLRDDYRACGDKEHPDWEEYDRAMRE